MNSLDPALPAARFDAYWRLMRFDRPIGILLLLWPTLWGLWMAGTGRPSPVNVLVFVAGVVLMRAAGCVMNDMADRDFDPHVARTRDRPLATGAVSLRAAGVTLALLLAAAAALVLLTNPLTIALAFVGAVLALAYPFFKRVTHLPQLVLGVAFSWGIPMAFAAETGGVPPAAWALVALNLVHVVIYDTLYAMVDREDDLAIGVRSTAILWGKHDLAVLRALSLALVGGLLALGWVLELSWPWFAGAAAAAALLARQQWQVRRREPSACFRAFRANHWVGLAIFAGLVGHYLVA